MSELRSLITDLKEVQSSLQIFPRSPIQISDPTAWQGILLAHHRQLAWEMPENHLAQPILSINIGAARKYRASD
jgi:AraC family transcriptional regulator